MDVTSSASPQAFIYCRVLWTSAETKQTKPINTVERTDWHQHIFIKCLLPRVPIRTTNPVLYLSADAQSTKTDSCFGTLRLGYVLPERTISEKENQQFLGH